MTHQADILEVERPHDPASSADATFREMGARLQVLSTWSHGPGVVVVTGPPGSGKTTLLEDLAASFEDTGQAVHVASRGDRVVVPRGAAVLLVDDAHRASDAVLRRVFASGELFCVLAGRQDLVAHLRSLTLDAPIIDLGSGAIEPQPRVSRSRLRLGIGAAAVVLAMLAGVALVGTGRQAEPRAPVTVVARASEVPQEAPPMAAVPAPPVALVAPPVPVSVPPKPAAPDAMISLPQEAPSPSKVEAALPVGALSDVALLFRRGDGLAEAAADGLATRLRAVGIMTDGPAATPGADQTIIRYYFDQDRAAAEAIRDQMRDELGRVPVEYARGPLSAHPGQIEVSIVAPQISGRRDRSIDDATVRARRVAPSANVGRPPRGD